MITMEIRAWRSWAGLSLFRNPERTRTFRTAPALRPRGGEALSGFSVSLPRSRCCFLHFCTATEVVVVGFWVGLVSFFHQKKKKGGGEQTKESR